MLGQIQRKGLERTDGIGMSIRRESLIMAYLLPRRTLTYENKHQKIHGM